MLRRGVPTVTNGPVQRFPELQPDGTPLHRMPLGLYAPIYPYVAAPLMRLGLRLVVRAASPSSRRSRSAPRARPPPHARPGGRRRQRPWLTLAGTHVWTFSFDVSPYSWMLTLNTASVALAAGAVDEGGRRGLARAFGAGLAGALAAFAHLLAAVARGGGGPARVAPRRQRSPAPHGPVAVARAIGPRRVRRSPAGPRGARGGPRHRARDGAQPRPLRHRLPHEHRRLRLGGTAPPSNLPARGLGAMLRFNAPLSSCGPPVTAAVLWSVRRSRASMAWSAPSPSPPSPRLPRCTTRPSGCRGSSSPSSSTSAASTSASIRPPTASGGCSAPSRGGSLLQCAPGCCSRSHQASVGDHAAVIRRRRAPRPRGAGRCSCAAGDARVRGGLSPASTSATSPRRSLRSRCSRRSHPRAHWRPRHSRCSAPSSALLSSWVGPATGDDLRSRAGAAPARHARRRRFAFICAVRAPQPACRTARDGDRPRRRRPSSVCLGVDRVGGQAQPPRRLPTASLLTAARQARGDRRATNHHLRGRRAPRRAISSSRRHPEVGWHSRTPSAVSSTAGEARSAPSSW